MAKAKKKSLPKNFEEMLDAGDVEEAGGLGGPDEEVLVGAAVEAALMTQEA